MTFRVRHYDRQNQEITLDEWVALFTPEYQRVARTPVGPGKQAPFVSTVWLGLDHAFGEGSAPLIFETMIFGIPALEDFQRRYTTEVDAVKGHAEAVVLARTALDLAEPDGAAEPVREEHHEQG